MATSKKQQIGIWVIAIFMGIGAITAVVAIPLALSNEKEGRTPQAQQQERLNELMAEYQAATEAQRKELSDKYYDTLSPYASRVDSFDADAVTKLEKTDLKKGDGTEVTSETAFTAYYIGWNPDGKIFDSSIDGDSLKAPFDVSPGQVIEGWTLGVDGMKVGGIRELTIPADLAYGERGSGELIPPNTPLKFVVFIIPTPEPVEIPQELLDYYQTGGN